MKGVRIANGYMKEQLDEYLTEEQQQELLEKYDTESN